MKNRILVTGGSGFVGQFLIRELLKDEHNTVIAIYNSNLPTDEIDDAACNLTWVKADIVKDDITSVMRGVDVVYHLAGYSSVSSSAVERDRLRMINVEGTRKICQASSAAKVKQVIFVSSIAACEASTESVVTESNGYPVTQYGRSKKDAEDLLIEGGLDCYDFTILRPTALFGENHAGSVFELVKRIHENRFFIVGSGKGNTNFLYIRDFIDLLLLVKGDERAYGQVFIASDAPLDLSSFVNYICESLGCRQRVLKIPMIFGYIAALLFDIASFIMQKPLALSRRRLKAMTNNKIYANRKIKKAMTANYKYGVQQGLQRSIFYYRQNDML